MTPEQEAAIAAAEADTLSKRERALIEADDDDVPTLDDYEDDRNDPFRALLDDLFESEDFEEYDDDKDYS